MVVALATGVNAAIARTAQVCTGPENLLPPPAGCFTIDTSSIGGRAFEDYVVTRPDSLYFDVQSRRRELARLSPDSAALYCAVNPAARTRAGLPALTFSSSTLRLHTQEWTDSDGIVRRADVARLRFTALRSSDDLTIPDIELAIHRERGSSRLDVSFFEAGPGPLVSGLHGIWFRVDAVTGEFTHPRFATLPEASRRLAFALFDRAPNLLSEAGSTASAPGPVDPPWTLSTAMEQAARFRDAVFAVPQPRFDPIVSLTCPLSGSFQTCVEEPSLRQFAEYLRLYGSDYLESASGATAEGLLANLRAWASADSLSVIPGIEFGRPNQPDFFPKYVLLQFLLPAITTWSILRDDPLVTTADRALIEGWLDRVAAFATEPFGGPQNDDMPWNPGYLTRAVRMAWGIVKGNNVALAEGVERIYIGLHQMRPDGSFPREAARGACALGYQVLQTHHLIVLAELAARQGYDAYALSVDGKTLHDAVKFILDVIDNHDLIAGYAAMNATNCHLPPGSPLISLPGISGNGDSPYAWVEHYIARFPGHPNAARLSRLDRGGLAANRPVHNIYSGANTTCFAAGRTSIPITPPSTAVEYYHAEFDHYFITAFPGEIDALDGGIFSGWARTGSAFGVFPLGRSGTSSVCRFFSTSFAPKSSHFYTPLADECAWVRTTNRDWQFEGTVFALKLPDAAGNCAADAAPLYRLYNNGRSGAPNHRYTTQLATRSDMVARGYAPEGFGPLGVIGCVPK